MCVKGEGGRPFATVENDDMSSSAARRSSPIAARIRARLAELGLAERKASEAMGWTATVLSATLRRIDAGGGLNTDTLPALEKLLGKPAQWILTGEEPAGTRLRDCPGWGEASAAARERYGLTDEQIAHAGATIWPKVPRYVEPALVRAMADAI